MSGKSLDTILFESFSNTIRQNINILMKNFPKIEENQISLTKQILNYLVSFDVVVDNFVNKCCILSSSNFRSFFLDILDYFNQIPLDMSKKTFDFPHFFNDEMKEKSITSFPFRLCTYYVSHTILTKIIYHLVIRTDLLKDDNYPLMYSTINQILFHEINEKNCFRLDLINISKWSIILHKMSKKIPDIIISDAFNHIQSSQLLHNNYHIFILQLYAFLYYPKEVLDNFPLISVTFQHLISILNSNRASNQLLKAGNKFIRNFLGYTIQYKHTQDLISLFKEINRCLTKIQNDQCSCYSTLVLFNTLSNEKLSFSPLQKFFTLITRQFPTSSPKITDVIKTFIAILNGPYYMNFFNMEKIDTNFFKSSPNRKDKAYIQQMLDIVYSNMNQFKNCQKELGLFLSKVASINIVTFIRQQLNKLVQNDFFQYNSEAVLNCSILILTNEAVILQNSKITSPDDPLMIQLKSTIINVCQKVMDDHPIDLFTTKCWIFDTNDFTNSLSLNTLSYEVEQIVDHTSLIPVASSDGDNDVASDIFGAIKRQYNDFEEIKFESYLNNIDENQLRYFQMNSIVHSSIEKALVICLLLADEIEARSQVYNRIPMYLFSDSPFVSALTIRVIQAFIHVKCSQSILSPLLTFQTFEYEQLYIYGLALLRTAKSLASCKIGLNVNSANSILAWQWILLAAPFPIIRELGLKLAEVVVSILPYENYPNVHKFVVKHDDEIYERAVSILCSTFSYGTFSEDTLKRVKFRDVMHTNSYLLYFCFFSLALKIFALNEDKCPKLNHTMYLTHALAISLINAKKSITEQTNYYFMLNLMALRLATSSSFDKYTSPEQILSLLKLGGTFLSEAKCSIRVFFLFYFAINPQLRLKFSFKMSVIVVYVFCFHFRLFMREHFKRRSGTDDFGGLEFINADNYRGISELPNVADKFNCSEDISIDSSTECENVKNIYSEDTSADGIIKENENPNSNSNKSAFRNADININNSETISKSSDNLATSKNNTNASKNADNSETISKSSDNFAASKSSTNANSSENGSISKSSDNFSNNIEAISKSSDSKRSLNASKHFNISSNEIVNYDADNCIASENASQPSENDDDPDSASRVSLATLHRALKHVLSYFHFFDLIPRGKICAIDIVKMKIYGDYVLFSSVCHLLLGLLDLFTAMRSSFALPDRSFFRSATIYKRDGHTAREQPFEASIWLPFLFSVASDKSNESRRMSLLADRVLSIYLSFVQIPECYVPSLLDYVDDRSRNLDDEILVSLLSSYPSLLLPVFCNGGPRNVGTIGRCFAEARGVADDLEEARKRLLVCSFDDDFDASVLGNAGTLIALSFYSLTTKANDFTSFRILYRLSLFALTSDSSQPSRLVHLVSRIRAAYTCEGLRVPADLLAALSASLAASYAALAGQYVAKVFELVEAGEDASQFVRVSLPWLSRAALSRSLVGRLLALKVRVGDVDVAFAQSPLPSLSEDVLDAVVGGRARLVAGCVLRETSCVDSRSVLIYMATKFSDELIPYLAGHFRFEFTYFMEIQRDERKLCAAVLSRALDVFCSLLGNRRELVEANLHVLFVHCYARRLEKPVSKKARVLREIVRAEGDEVEDCELAARFAELIGGRREAREEAADEAFRWMVSSDDIKVSLTVIPLFESFVKNKVLKREASELYALDMLQKVKTTAAMLSRCGGQLENASDYCEYIAALLRVAGSIGEPPVELAVDFLRCNSMDFWPIFPTSLEIVSGNCERCAKQARRVFLSLITADLTPSIIEAIFGLISKMISSGIFRIESDPTVFLAALPYLTVNCSEKVDSLNFLTKEELPHHNPDSPVAALPHLTANCSEKVESLNFLTKEELPQKLDSLVAALLMRMPGDDQFLAFSFLMRVLAAGARAEYSAAIARISLAAVRRLGPTSELSASVFSPLAQFFVSRRESVEEIGELTSFARTFANFDSAVLPHKKKAAVFPDIFEGQKFALSFQKSFPSVFRDFRCLEVELVAELCSFVLSVQPCECIKNEKELSNAKAEQGVAPGFDLESGVDARVRRIDRALQIVGGRKARIDKESVKRIVKVNCDVFRNIESVGDLLK